MWRGWQRTHFLVTHRGSKQRLKRNGRPDELLIFLLWLSEKENSNWNQPIAARQRHYSVLKSKCPFLSLQFYIKSDSSGRSGCDPGTSTAWIQKRSVGASWRMSSRQPELPLRRYVLFQVIKMLSHRVVDIIRAYFTGAASTSTGNPSQVVFNFSFLSVAYTLPQQLKHNFYPRRVSEAGNDWNLIMISWGTAIKSHLVWLWSWWHLISWNILGNN